MWKNGVIKSMIFMIILSMSCILFFFITINKMNPYYKVSYSRGIQLKFNKLKKIKGKKIVIIGGSNVNFGIDSDLIEEKLNIPTVNMGIHGGLGTKFMIDSIEKYMKAGDILIVSREYGDEDKYLNLSGIEMGDYITYIPKEAFYILSDLSQFSSILKSIINKSQRNLKEYRGQEQLNEAFGTYMFSNFKNDNLIEQKGTPYVYSHKEILSLVFENNNKLIKYYKKIQNKMEKKNVKIFFSMPAVYEKVHRHKDKIDWYKKMSDETSIPLLSDREYSYGMESMFDTDYHLNYIGRKDRTEGVISDLKNKISSSDLNEMKK